MKEKYKEILYLERPKSKHPSLSMEQRAAQFSPFAALKGYEESIAEEGRIVETKIILSDDEKNNLDDKINYILNHKNDFIKIKVTYFKPDLKKKGGSYLTIEGELKRIDLVKRKLILKNKIEIPFNEIYNIDIFLNSKEDNANFE